MDRAAREHRRGGRGTGPAIGRMGRLWRDWPRQALDCFRPSKVNLPQFVGLQAIPVVTNSRDLTIVGLGDLADFILPITAPGLRSLK